MFTAAVRIQAGVEAEVGAFVAADDGPGEVPVDGGERA
jgi:hypothetical protein